MSGRAAVDQRPGTERRSSSGPISFRYVSSAGLIPRAEWDALAKAAGADLMAWGLLSAFETSGSMTPEKGWQPLHCLAERGGRLVACAPLYLKTHSWGEFVFDFEWTEVAKRVGLRWYPKLVGMVPATPVPSWRLLVDPAEDAEELNEAFLGEIERLVRRERLGGAHFLWLHPGAEDLARSLDRRGWAEWTHQAFLWENRGWTGFDDMLASFSKNMRRNVARDRAAVVAGGLRSEFIRAGEAPPSLHEAMGNFYLRTNDRYGPWAARVLEPGFFAELARVWPEGMAYSVARDAEGEVEAAALFYVGDDRIYGRYWGARADRDRLHFETCYYRPMEWALSAGYGSIDPGMGGEHKARRGFRALPARSFHLPADARIQDAMRRVLKVQNQEALSYIDGLNADLPYKAIKSD